MCRGDNIRRGWQTTHDTYLKKYGHAFEVLEVQPLGADGAVVLGKWHLTGSPSDGDGVFSVVLDHTSLAPPTDSK